MSKSDVIKPRIVIVDENLSFAGPLQSKFIYEFWDAINIEIVTDKNYYDEMFDSLQKIDVLIVDMKFYSIKLRQHEIENIFIMSEKQNYENEKIADAHIIYKYTNVKGIFSEIIAKSGLDRFIPSVKKNAPEVILITSASGGAGKTTLALGIAGALSDMYKKVLYIESARMQSFQYFFEDLKPVIKQEIYDRMAKAGRTIYHDIKIEIKKDVFYYLPHLKAPLMSFGIGYDLFGKIAKSAKESDEFDYIIVDAESVFDEYKAKMISNSDKVIIVTGQDKKDAFATKELVKNINNINSDKYLFICNKYSDNRQNVYTNGGSMPFKIDEYVDEFKEYHNMTYYDFAKEESIKKVAFLLV